MPNPYAIMYEPESNQNRNTKMFDQSGAGFVSIAHLQKRAVIQGGIGPHH